MYPIKEISTATMAFPAYVSNLMPSYDEIPKEFKNWNNQTKWNRLFNDWFFGGLSKLELKPKEGVDQNKALRHIKAIMGSFEPKHEHKEAAVAFLFSEWFEDADWEKGKQKATK